MPINSDSPSADDKLGRLPFAKNIAINMVKNFPEAHESIVFGLTGAWGSGKSTLLGFLEKEIKKELVKQKKDYIIYNFNPWMFSGQEALQREFLEGLLVLLKDKFQKVEKIREWI